MMPTAMYMFIAVISVGIGIFLFRILINRMKGEREK